MAAAQLAHGVRDGGRGSLAVEVAGGNASAVGGSEGGAARPASFEPPCCDGPCGSTCKCNVATATGEVVYPTDGAEVCEANCMELCGPDGGCCVPPE
eukprot:CAMPEP_0179332210 /NCGR_PEP_ID=MMETSP0797-20121207/64604_1 /TAXON_ID=47934 /ORGANISM="Dinophysis acuminata, Strain DAEP01" /LENGTH=96 /DNA_ID=CAMNT_0021045047 /DNA_START=87 /DNA_END=377 /DNA_ORIENTATION=-